MTPLKLELSGFTCFRNQVSIDFSELELFAISGPTGSGKTTLLDALTYALYGQTARLGSKGLDVLLSPGLMQMYVVLEFKTSRGTYKVTRTVDKRSSGTITRNTRIEELQSNASYRQLAESEKLKEADAKLEQLVGLDYDGFTRSVLLPQGAFDEFLRGDSSKRRKLLVSLLGLDRVETMQKEAGRISREADLQQKALTERLEQDYAGATPERREALRDEVSNTQTLVKDFSLRETKLVETLKGLEEVKTLLDDMQKVKRFLDQLKAQESGIKEKQKKLELGKKAQGIAPQMEQLGRFKEKHLLTEQDLQKVSLQLETQQMALQEAEFELSKHQNALSERLPILTEKLTALAEVRPLMAQLKSRGGRLELAQKANPGSSYSDTAWEDLQSQQAQIPSLKQTDRLLKQVVKELQTLKVESATILKESQDLENLLQTLLEQGNLTKELHLQAKETYDAAILVNQALALREHLHEGDVCPVCEQIIGKLPETKSAELQSLQLALKTSEENLETVRAQYRNAKAKLTSLQERHSDKLAATDKLECDKDNFQTHIAEALKPYKLESVDALEAALSDERSSLLASLAANIHGKTEGLDPETLESQLQKEKRDLEDSFKISERKVQSLQTSLATQITRKELLEEQIVVVKEELALTETSLQKALLNAEFMSLELAKAALLTSMQIKELETEISGFLSQKEGYERREVELQAKLAGRSLDLNEYETLKQEEKDLKGQLSEAQTRLGRLEAELSALEKQLERAKSLEKDRAAFQKTQDTYRALSQDLQGNRFQEFLLSQVQARLAIRASHILREVTDGRYDLRLIDGDYQVRDAWTVGETRSAKTLSGGETFIASLALALALSDTIAGSHALGALFLDEGFGTLDAITLDSVAAVLENLTKEGRMVGIITHVSALTERLPARLTVTKDKDGSSISWDLA